MSDFRLESPEFEDGEAIPERYGYTEQNINPPLTISGVPDTAESLALIVDDPDAREPAGKIWDHWIVWNISPDTQTIPEDWDVSGSGASEGRNDYGETGYGGPNPPDGEHTYQFRLYALSEPLDLASNASKDEVEQAAEEKVIDKARLQGTYSP